MSKRFSKITVAAVFVLYVFYCIGCTKIKYAELNARSSETWLKDAVIYEVYLRSFSKEGTFKALEVRIPELKELGVTIVSLLPIHPIGEFNRIGSLGSPYAVKDFYNVNDEYGTLNDFKSLINAAHQQNMKIIIGLVADRAAWDSQFLLEHPEWFVHNAEGAIVAPNIECMDAARIDYARHELRKYMIAMMKFWVQDVGIDGFKCSSADIVPTDFWDIARAELEKIKPVVMISEDALPEYHIKTFDVSCSCNISNALTRIIDGTSPASVLDDSLKKESCSFPIGSLHLRSNSIYHNNIDDTGAVKLITAQRLKEGAVLAFTLPGVPLIYNGEEAGSRTRTDLYNKMDIDWTHDADFRLLYKTLVVLRCSHPVIRSGKYLNAVNTDSKNVYSFFRLNDTDTVLTVINFRNEKKQVNIRMPAGSSIEWNDLFSDKNIQIKDSCLSITVAPLESLILIPNIEREKE